VVFAVSLPAPLAAGRQKLAAAPAGAR